MSDLRQIPVRATMAGKLKGDIMINSMTAYAREQVQHEMGLVLWECRSVNHRFLDVHMKIPDVFREFEMTWRQEIKQVCRRGKIDCSLSFSAERLAPDLQLNAHIVERLAGCCEALPEHPMIQRQLNAIDVLKWPQAVLQAPLEVGELEGVLTHTLQQALGKLQSNRAQEGKQLALILQKKVDEVEALVHQAQQLAPRRLEAIRLKLEKKLSELTERADPDRLEQELVLFAQKLDVEEECDRLQTHILAARTHLQEDVVSGKHLDFLMQEFNREANTLASKSNHAELTQVALALKVQIEQMREQIQNVE